MAEGRKIKSFLYKLLKCLLQKPYLALLINFFIKTFS